VNVPGKGRVRTAAYRQWIDTAGWEAKAQGARPVPGPVEVRCVFGRPDKRRRDLDNLLKASLDLLVRLRLIEDDSKVVRIVAEWAEGEARAVISWASASRGGS
jgi:crossover junction endodeoxyribonuclease RusA